MNKRQRKKRKRRFSCYPWLRTRNGRKILSISKTIGHFADSHPIFAQIEGDCAAYTFTKKGRYISDDTLCGLDLMKE